MPERTPSKVKLAINESNAVQTLKWISPPTRPTMKTEKKSETCYEELACFECETGRLRTVYQDYQTTLFSGTEVTVPNVPMLRCDSCGDTVIGDEGNQKIDA